MEHRVTIVNGRGQRLAGVWHLPDGAATRAVVVAHGLLSGKESEKHRAVCESIAAAGATALRFDFAGRGESEGRFADLTAGGQVEDLRAVVAAARERDVTEVALVGSSLGGAVSILAAAGDSNISALVTVAAPAVLPRQARPSWEPLVDPVRGERLGDGFFADAARHDIPAAASRVRAEWLILHGAADEVVPPEDALMLAAANPAAQLALHPTAGHRFSDLEELEWLVSSITAFVLA